MKRSIRTIAKNYTRINGIVPGVKGRRAFPTREFKDSDPFLMLDHIGPENVGTDYTLDGSGHDHPHRGFETLTFMFEGSMNHRDSIGNKATLKSGAVQRMNAGSGIIHGGDMYSDSETGIFHEIQLWVNLPASKKMSPPEIENVSTPPEILTNDYSLRAISGTINGLTGDIHTTSPTQIAHLKTFRAGKVSLNDFKDGNTLLLYVLDGEIRINDTTVNTFDLVQFTESGNEIEFEFLPNTQVLVLSGEPLNEPVVFGGPFVMNTQEEIEQAQIDFKNGLFGSIEYEKVTTYFLYHWFCT